MSQNIVYARADLSNKFRNDILREYIGLIRKDAEISQPKIPSADEMELDEFINTITHLRTIAQMYKCHIERAYQILTTENISHTLTFVNNYIDYRNDDKKKAQKKVESNKNGATELKRGKKPKVK
jgi:hypothetical protein